MESSERRLLGIDRIVAVGSAKGGVGKSTVAVNLAVALVQDGARVGLVDADILGPSVPVLLGLTAEPPAMTADGRIVPVERHGVRAISMGLLTPDDRPAILRGPMVTKYLRMFLESVAWGELDYLILDLPPGTGDTQLTLAQTFPLSGAIVVTTPQDVSLKIARRGLRMFQTVHVPILGIVENMSGFACPHCGETTDVFGRGGGERMSASLGVPFLGAIPMDARVAASGDRGIPIVLDAAGSATGLAYRAIVRSVRARLAAGAKPAPSFVWAWSSGEGEPGFVREPRVGEERTVPAGFRKRDERTLSIAWDDGAVSDLDVRDLRLACKCAHCIEELSGRPLLDPASVRIDVVPRSLASVGNYAVGIEWNDGHNTGIYSFEMLRDLGERVAATPVEEL